MSVMSDFFEWFSLNLDKIVFSVIGVIIVFFVYEFLARQITRLKEQRKLEENVAFTLKRISQWVAGLVILVVVFAQFGVEVGLIAGLLALAGGSILGFVAMNTLGSAIES